MIPIFKNRQNTLYKIDGVNVWKDRSACTAAIILAIKDNKTYILAEKRSQNMPDGQGLWVVPGGYFDWDENNWESLSREIYEETSFCLKEYEKYIKFDNDKQPFFVYSEPDENRQNIVLWHVIILDLFDIDLPKDVELFTDMEVDKVQWIYWDEIFKEVSEYKWAFNHDIRIRMAINKYTQYLML
jgi:8-oxo-dGTP pyrophosphatase MutT (NUDIX family)